MDAKELKGHVGGLVAGRWQVPAAVCALGLGALALLQLRPQEKPVAFESVLADVLALAEAGRYGDAANAVANLLEYQPPFAPAAQATLHDVMADVIYRQELARSVPNAHNAALLLKHHDQAIALGHRPDAADLLRAAQAHEWLADTTRAIQGYRAVLTRDPDAPTRRTCLQALVRLLDGRAGCEAERRGYVEALLAEAGVSVPYAWWTLRQAMADALDAGDVARARAVLEHHGERFLRSDLRGYYHYLWAWLLLSEGRSDEARPLVQWVDEWIAENPRADTEMDRAGFLPALNRWLAGSVELADYRPQAALENFESALELDPYGELATRASIGRAQALAMLERHDAARREILATVARLRGRKTALAAAQPRLRNCLIALHEERQARGDFAEAVAYLTPALELVADTEQELRMRLLDRLGKAAARAAERESDPARRVAFYRRAGTWLEQAAGLAALDESVRVTLLWQSAQNYDLAGCVPDVQRVLERFVDGRTQDPRLPGALLQLGLAYAADGRLPAAIEVYRRLIDEYSPLDESLRARLLMADCLMRLGEDRYAQAESALLDLLEGEGVSPEAQVYRDALFTLCDLYFEQGRYAETISRAENFLVFYPDDPERAAVLFMLADAYRRSALRLRASTAGGMAAERTIAEARARLRRAAGLFEQLARPVEAGAKTADLPAEYARWALLYRGDSLFELNDSESLEEALLTYRQAAARYQAEPAALTAQLQIASIHLRLGRQTEAARAIERARWLLRTIPDAAFAREPTGVGREEWERYLVALASSQLFKDLLTEAP